MKIREVLLNMFESRKNKLRAYHRNIVKNIKDIPKRKRQQALVKVESRINELNYLRKQTEKSLSTSKKEGN